MMTSLPPLYLLRLDQVPILKQLQIEEALLRTDERNWCVMNTGSSPAIVMGISGKPERDLHLGKCSKHPVEIIRRFSGGGTVFVDHATCFFTVICNESCAAIPPFPEKILQWNAFWYADPLASHGFQVRENDYALGERKFGGNAQYLSKKRWLHHTSLLWDYSSENMDYLQMPHRMPEYRKQREHADFLCKLKDCFSEKEEFLESLVEQLKRRFTVHEASFDLVEEVLEKPHRKSTIVLETATIGS